MSEVSQSLHLIIVEENDPTVRGSMSDMQVTQCCSCFQFNRNIQYIVSKHTVYQSGMNIAHTFIGSQAEFLADIINSFKKWDNQELYA